MTTRLHFDTSEPIPLCPTAEWDALRPWAEAQDARQVRWLWQRCLSADLPLLRAELASLPRPDDGAEIIDALEALCALHGTATALTVSNA